MIFSVGVAGSSGVGGMIGIALIAALIYGAIALLIYTWKYLRHLHDVCAEAGIGVWTLLVPIVNMYALSKIAKKKVSFIIWLCFELIFLSVITFAPVDYEGGILIAIAVLSVYVEFFLIAKMVSNALCNLNFFPLIITMFFEGYISYILPTIIAFILRT